MKLMKSFLALLLLGGMSLAGCSKDKSSNNTPSGQTEGEGQGGEGQGGEGQGGEGQGGEGQGGEGQGGEGQGGEGQGGEGQGGEGQGGEGQGGEGQGGEGGGGGGEQIVTKTTYFIETKSWFNAGGENEHVFVYAFKNESEPAVENAAFPGEEATWVRDLTDGKKLFSYDIDEKYDTFIVSRVDGETQSYQTVDIAISSLGEDNCIYFEGEAAPANVGDKISVGHYNYEFKFGLSSESGTISVGGHVDVTFKDVTGEVSYVVNPADSATVEINEGVATISSSVVGTSSIKFSDESGVEVTYTLTVNEAPTAKTVYFQSKQFFNSGAENENVKAYCWSSTETEVNNTWPGEATTWIEDQENNQKIFSFEIDLTRYDMIMFVKTVNDTATLKTEDISVSLFTDENNCVYLNADDWSGLDTGINIGFFHYSPAALA